MGSYNEGRIKMVDLTNFTNVTTLQGLVYETNNVVGNILFTGGMITFFIIILMTLLRNGEPFENCLAVSGWSMFVVSLIFWLGHLVPTLLVLAFLMISAFSTLYLYTTKR
jgi:ABC-type Fe3+-siderophore transport system permease subunit